MGMERQEEGLLSLEEQSDLIVRVFQVSLDTLKESGLNEVDALNGMLSQIAILVDSAALQHACDLNEKYRAAYLAE